MHKAYHLGQVLHFKIKHPLRNKKIEYQKNVDMHFSIALSYCARHADKNKPKQPYVCMKDFQITTTSPLWFSVKKSKIWGGLGNPQTLIFFKNISHSVFL